MASSWFQGTEWKLQDCHVQSEVRDTLEETGYVYGSTQPTTNWYHLLLQLCLHNDWVGTTGATGNDEISL